MHQYDDLLVKIAEGYCIQKGNSEDELNYMSRIIYSACALVGYTSLWDDNNSQTISVNHMTSRLKNILESYMKMFPEVSVKGAFDLKIFPKTVYDIYLRAGYLYHSPNRICPSIFKECDIGNITFVRGAYPTDEFSVSGMGVYKTNQEASVGNSITSYFQLQTTDLYSSWELALKDSVWTKALYDNNVDYMRMVPPFTQGYWTNKPDDKRIGILRKGVPGGRSYYFYRIENGELYTSVIQRWKYEDMRIYELCNACLKYYDLLPEILYVDDGDIVELKPGYLISPSELNMLKLYSWPDMNRPFSSGDFYRVCNREIFMAIKPVLAKIGYTFKEVQHG